MSIRFLYFDLGNVLLYFSHRRAAAQLAGLAGAKPEEVFEALFRSDVNYRCDAGQITGAQFADHFRSNYPCEVPNEVIHRAASDIFVVNGAMKAVVAQLRAAGHRLGILSNTCDMHTEFFSDGRYSHIPSDFDVVVLSYKLKLMKPDASIYLKAAEMAGVAPQEVFYTDDIQANVDGAKAAGFDAVLFTSAAEYAAEARKRGIRFNY
ncbi:MAG: HAD family phosphatase [Pirellulales bacterium]